VKEVAAADRTEREGRYSPCTRYVHFPHVRDPNELGIVIDTDYYDIVADSVRERGFHISEESSHRSDFFMLWDERLGVRIKDVFYATSSKNRGVILVYGSYENRQKFDEKEGLNKLAPPGF